MLLVNLVKYCIWTIRNEAKHEFRQVTPLGIKACFIRTLSLRLKTDFERFPPDIYSKLGGCPFNGPLSGTKYLTRAASPIQNASTAKSSLPFSKRRSCALLCTVVRRF